MNFSLDKQVGPFPIKYWIIIGVAGVGIGWFVTRNSSGSKSTPTGTNENDVRAYNDLNRRLIALTTSNESVMGQYNDTLSTLRTQLQSIQDRLNKPVTSTPSTPVTPTRSIDTILPQLPRNDEVRMYDAQGYLRSVSYGNGITSRF